MRRRTLDLAALVLTAGHLTAGCIAAGLAAGRIAAALAALCLAAGLAACTALGPDTADQSIAPLADLSDPAAPASDMRRCPGPGCPEPAECQAGGLHCVGPAFDCFCLGSSWSCKGPATDGGYPRPPAGAPAMMPQDGEACTGVASHCWLAVTPSNPRCACEAGRWRCRSDAPTCQPAGRTGEACAEAGATCKLGFCWWCECVPGGGAASWYCSTLGYIC
jgi:hypothetical protein